VKYLVRIDGETVVVEIGVEGVRVDGEPVRAQLAAVEGTPIQLLTIDGAIHRLAVRRGDSRGAYTFWTDSHRIEVEALDERTRTIREAAGSSRQAGGPAPLLAPMPGLIVRVNVLVGDQVQPGQGLVVMEAMKMENELRAGSAGTVRAVLVTAGIAVEKGSVLVELE
jgi:pyruvate carboxylase subunit B